MFERNTFRRVAATASIIAAAVYFLIAMGFVYAQPSDSPTLANGDPRPIMAVAGVVFVLGGVLILVWDKRLVYVPGIVLQVIVLVGYVIAAPERIPSYEFWGLLCKVAQVVVLFALAYLVLTTREATGLAKGNEPLVAR